METRGTGLKPQRLPSEWEKRPLQMTKESPQGPAKTGKATSRSLAPIAGTVVTQLQQGDPGGFISSVLASRPSAAVRTKPGDDGNVGGTSKGGSEEAAGSATKTTGSKAVGKTSPKGMF